MNKKWNRRTTYKKRYPKIEISNNQIPEATSEQKTKKENANLCSKSFLSLHFKVRARKFQPHNSLFTPLPVQA